jgi:hypothetical protein
MKCSLAKWQLGFEGFDAKVDSLSTGSMLRARVFLRNVSPAGEAALLELSLRNRTTGVIAVLLDAGASTPHALPATDA